MILFLSLMVSMWILPPIVGYFNTDPNYLPLWALIVGIYVWIVSYVSWRWL